MTSLLCMIPVLLFPAILVEGGILDGIKGMFDISDKDAKVTVNRFEWTRTVDIEVYKEFLESGPCKSMPNSRLHSVHWKVVGTEKVEQRLASDGKLYTYRDMLEWYGPEKRFAEDRKSYTWKEFQKYYPEAGAADMKWFKAEIDPSSISKETLDYVASKWNAAKPKVCKLTWNPDAMCDKSLASDRAQWLVSNQGMSLKDAQQKVMDEFPEQFAAKDAKGKPMVKCFDEKVPDFVCEYYVGKWKKKMTQTQKGTTAFPYWPEEPINACLKWNPDAMCDKSSAGDRAQWLVSNQEMSLTDAQNKVMGEFSAQFSAMAPGWNPGAMCDKSLASDRAQWLVSNQGMSLKYAQQKVMGDFPEQFGVGCERKANRAKQAQVFLTMVAEGATDETHCSVDNGDIDFEKWQLLEVGKTYNGKKRKLYGLLCGSLEIPHGNRKRGIAPDGKSYTYEEYVDHYGSSAPQKWEKSKWDPKDEL